MAGKLKKGAIASRMKRLVLVGEGDAAGQRIIFDVYQGRARMRKIRDFIRKGEILDWSSFSDDEALRIEAFLKEFIRFSIARRLRNFPKG